MRTIDRDAAVGNVETVASDYDPDGSLGASAVRRLLWRLARSGKVCGGPCRRALPLTAFSRDSVRADGLRVICRDCDRDVRLARRRLAAASEPGKVL